MMVYVVEVALGILVDRRKRVLLGLRSPSKEAFPNCWDAIGGKLVKEEAPTDALAREIEEELGVVPTHTQFIGSNDWHHEDGNQILRRHLFGIYAWTGGKPFNASDEHSELQWFCISELAKIPNLAFKDTIDESSRAVAFAFDQE